MLSLMMIGITLGEFISDVNVLNTFDLMNISDITSNKRLKSMHSYDTIISNLDQPFFINHTVSYEIARHRLKHSISDYFSLLRQAYKKKEFEPHQYYKIIGREDIPGTIFTENNYIENAKLDITAILAVSNTSHPIHQEKSPFRDLAIVIPGVKSLPNLFVVSQAWLVPGDNHESEERQVYGFQKAWRSIRDHTLHAIRTQIEKCQEEGFPINSITMFSHSLGSAISVYAMSDLIQKIRFEFHLPSLKLVLLGTPKQGNDMFAQSIAERFARHNVHVFDFYHNTDPITYTPSGIWFHHPKFNRIPLGTAVQLLPSQLIIDFAKPILAHLMYYKFKRNVCPKDEKFDWMHILAKVFLVRAHLNAFKEVLFFPHRPRSYYLGILSWLEGNRISTKLNNQSFIRRFASKLKGCMKHLNPINWFKSFYGFMIPKLVSNQNFAKIMLNG